jgi:hypothetical protein
VSEKTTWQGIVVGIQPRIVLMRSFDQRSHSYLGYVLRLNGTVGGDSREFLIAIGNAAQQKHAFRAGDTVCGCAERIANPHLEIAEFYKVTKLKVLDRPAAPPGSPPPWLGTPPDVSVYRERGHRRLSARTYETKCQACIWGCTMPVEIIVDQWKPDVRRYRQETFCYGPRSCRHYAAGPVRKVPGRKGTVWEEADWVDEEATAQRGDDD